MENLIISLSSHIKYKFYGKFVSPSAEWMHMSRELPEYELMIVTEGSLYIADKYHRYTLKCGDYIIMKPGLQYGFKPSKCSFYWFHFSCNEQQWPEEKIITLNLQGTVKSIHRLSVIFAQFNDIVVTYHDEYTTNFFATSILLELYNQTSYPETVLDSLEERLYRNIIEYIKWNCSYKLKVSDVAKEFGYHPKYLTTIFKKKAGIPLKHYLIDKSMECAKSELSNTDRSILSIALSMGYSDGPSFSYSFKHAVGVTPTEYRNNYQSLKEVHK